MKNYPPTQMFVLPNIILSDPPDAEPLNHYGMMRKRFLKANYPAHYGKMLVHEELYPHCRIVQQQAQERFDKLMEHFVFTNPPPNKVVDGLAWASHMGMLKDTAEEIVRSELIYNKAV
jgi:hypothetical protein